ncbi:UNKNOWN [Stylonychia lemnae]|uniref:Uncharacterized protein n=1 Tax=Stylonychia lemnae TaxID=5949 RepID=A0A077ZW12_STYLE|nr:UNKNOWN [Stylonychia lemnae]|eukprot:CDW74064.1 UNKNOWN [Stylonychia lemnae]
MQSAQFIMPRSFLLGFLTIYSISQYLLHLVFTFLPISFQDTYLNFGLLAVSYFIIKELREKRSREVETFEMQYLSGNECNLSLLLITLGGSMLAMLYQMSLGYVLGNAGLLGLSRYAALVMGSYFGYCLNETQLAQYSSISTNQRLSQIIITFIGQIMLACTFSQYTLALLAIYYSTGLTINYLKEKQDILTEIDHMYYYKLI